LKGRTLILADSSGSMSSSSYSKRGSLTYETQSLLFGAVLGKRNKDAVDFYQYDSKVHPRINLNAPVLRIVERPSNGGATYTHAAINETFRNHDRIVVLTDGQAHDSDATIRHIKVPVYTFNVAGYGVSDRISGKDNRYIFGGGLTDAAFKMLPLLEAGKNADWPF